MSLEQIMALRKLALIQFSKLVERQHSNMIRKLRIFPKKMSAAEFQKVYDSIDSLNAGGPSRGIDITSNVTTSNTTSSSASRLFGAIHNSDSSSAKDAALNNNSSQADKVVMIDSKKVSHQLGAQMGIHPTTGLTKKMTSIPSNNASSGGGALRKKRANKSSFKNKGEKSQSFSNQLSSREISVNYSNVSNEESSSSIVLDYEFVNLTMNNQSTNQLESKSSQSGGVVDPLPQSSRGSSSNLHISSSSSSVINKINPITNTASRTSKYKTFGLTLNVIMQSTGQPLPQQILEAMRLVRRMSTSEVGIFRKNGNKARINKLKELIDKNESIDFQTSESTVFDIADTIKLYFRELPECLITNKLSNILLSNYTSKTDFNINLRIALNKKKNN